MATGSGKTLTAMICAYYLFSHDKPLLIVIAAPYVPLVEQWCREVTLFGLHPINLVMMGGVAERTQMLRQLRRKLRLGLSEIEVVVVTHDTLCTKEFLQAVKEFECARLLIADEAHNLGRRSFIDDPPEFFEYRLGLSATPVRQYDPEGSAAVLSFLGDVVFRFTLGEAIGRCLVQYDYFLHPVTLTPSEMDGWYELSAQIRQNAWRKDEGKPDDYLARLYRERRLLLEVAQGKIAELSRLLDAENARELRHTLIYATDKAPEQLDAVNRLLRTKNIRFHQLTAEETTHRSLTTEILKAFQEGGIQVLTAKRVLDEGLDIPQISRAYILASTTVERQWIQRRGRLLRVCNEIRKTHSVIHDLIALPAQLEDIADDDARALVKSELRRAQEFASLARNAGTADGPLNLIHQMVKAAVM